MEMEISERMNKRIDTKRKGGKKKNLKKISTLVYQLLAQ
jgi:hypothetical protein